MSEPTTEAGKRLLRSLDDISASPLAGVSFPNAADDIADIEAEAITRRLLATVEFPSSTLDVERQRIRDAVEALCGPRGHRGVISAKGRDAVLAILNQP